MKLNRSQFYAFLLVVFLLPLILYKLFWISSSETALGKVLSTGYIKSRSQGYQKFPVVIFETKEDTIQFNASYNLPFQPGDDFPVRYSLNNPKDARLNTFWGCWIETVIICGVLFLALTIIFISKGLIPRNKSIHLTLMGIKYSDRQ